MEENKKLKIAVIVKSFNLYGGMERYAVEVAQRLRQKGHFVHIYAREADASLLYDMEYFPLSKSCTFSSVLGAMVLANDVANKIKGKKYDIIHSHERAYCQDVLTQHCFSYKGSLTRYSGIRYLDQKYLSPRSWMYLWLEERQMQSPYLVSVSKVIQDDIATFYHPQGRGAIIAPGVDIDHFNPFYINENREKVRKELAVEKKKVILFVGSEFKRKGLDYVIPSLGKGMRLFVVGQGDNISRYKNMAATYGVSEKVVFVGLSSDVRKYYAAADIVTLPSTSEAFGMTILEAMACGLPVVTTQNTGVSHIIDNGVNGFVVQQGEDLAGFLSTFFERPLKKKIADLARKTAQKYSWQTISNQYEDLFYAIVRKRSQC